MKNSGNRTDALVVVKRGIGGRIVVRTSLVGLDHAVRDTITPSMNTSHKKVPTDNSKRDLEIKEVLLKGTTPDPREGMQLALEQPMLHKPQL